MSEPTHAQVGRAPCGCIKMVMVERFNVVVDAAEEIREAEADGIVFERVTLADARAATWDCPTHEKQKVSA